MDMSRKMKYRSVEESYVVCDLWPHENRENDGLKNFI